MGVLVMLIYNKFTNCVGVAVWSQAPLRRTIWYKKSGKVIPYFLSFPVVLFRVGFSGQGKVRPSKLSVAFSKDKKPDKKDDVYFPALPNIAKGDMRVCIPFDGHFHPSVDSLVKYVVGEFWSTAFENVVNGGLAQCWDLYKEKNGFFRDFEKWEKKTRQNHKWMPDKGMLKACSYKEFLDSEPVGLDEYEYDW